MCNEELAAEEEIPSYFVLIKFGTAKKAVPSKTN